MRSAKRASKKEPETIFVCYQNNWRGNEPYATNAVFVTYSRRLANNWMKRKKRGTWPIYNEYAEVPILKRLVKGKCY